MRGRVAEKATGQAGFNRRNPFARAPVGFAEAIARLPIMPDTFWGAKGCPAAASETLCSVAAGGPAACLESGRLR